MQKIAGILLLFLCIIIILATGCVRQTSPAPTINQTPQVNDSIIGSWMTEGSSTLYYVFSPDGNFRSGELKHLGIGLSGKWSKTEENKYIVKIEGTSDMNFVYVPSGDYIFWNVSRGIYAKRYNQTL